MSGIAFRLGWVVLAVSLLSGAAVFATAAETIDDLRVTTDEQYAIMCNTCTTSAQFTNKALTTYPRAGNSAAFVYNLSSGQVRAVMLDWDREFQVQDGGYEIPVEPGVVAYVDQAGRMYRQNGNSLAFRFVFRGDGSAYWKPATGGPVELRGPGLRVAWMGGVQSDDPWFDAKGNPAPGVNSPIDARGYQFPANFGNTFPNYPRSSYDLGFGLPGTISEFARQIANQLPNGGVSGVFNGTVSTSAGVSAPMSLFTGGTQISKQVQSNIGVFVPMKDGGFALVEIDLRLGTVTIKEIVDSSGFPLPPANGTTPAQHLGGREIRFGPNPRGDAGLDAFMNWAARNRIEVRGVSMGNGGSVKCSTNGSTQVICTIYPT